MLLGLCCLTQRCNCVEGSPLYTFCFTSSMLSSIICCMFAILGEDASEAAEGDNEGQEAANPSDEARLSTVVKSGLGEPAATFFQKGPNSPTRPPTHLNPPHFLARHHRGRYTNKSSWTNSTQRCEKKHETHARTSHYFCRAERT